MIINTKIAIKEIFEEYKQGRLEGVRFQESIYNLYKESDKNNEVKQSIFDIVKQTLVLGLREDMWRAYFSPDRQMYRQIDLIQNQNRAEESLKVVQENPQEVMLMMMINMAHACCSRNYEKSYDVEKEKTWLEVFAEIPQFAKNLEKEKQRVIDSDLKIKEQFKDYYHGILINKNKPIVESYEMTIPIKFLSENDVSSHPNAQRLMNELVENFNNFGLEGYMDTFKPKCCHSSAYINNGLNVKFNCHTALTIEEEKEIKKEFLGQIEHGWGASSKGIILIDKQEIGFDYIVDDNLEFTKTKVTTKKLKF